MTINSEIKGFRLAFETSQKCFSPGQIDTGTLAMLSKVDFQKGQKVLDLGCGYGVVGIIAAKLVGASNVFMVDADPEAVSYSRRNALKNNVEAVNVIHSDGIESLTESEFDLILCNPPYHADFSVPKRFIEKGFNRLKIGGRMFMVTKRKDWYRNKLVSIFGGARIHEINGYCVFEAEKRQKNYNK